eukprot:397069_1
MHDSDYDGTEEYIEIKINNELYDTCDPGTNACNAWFPCIHSQTISEKVIFDLLIVELDSFGTSTTCNYNGDYISFLGNVTLSCFVHSDSPTQAPTIAPTWSPSAAPTRMTHSPSVPPSAFPSTSPTSTPTARPSNSPSFSPSKSPTDAPTIAPSNTPSFSPTKSPTRTPTLAPSHAPSVSPSVSPTDAPSLAPSNTPSSTPTEPPIRTPSLAPSNTPSATPNESPTDAPTLAPSTTPSFSPTKSPTDAPTLAPSNTPSATPTKSPTRAPTQTPSSTPSFSPTKSPTRTPTLAPSHAPSVSPSVSPTDAPSLAPSNTPSSTPTEPPIRTPSLAPSNTPSFSPTKSPTRTPSLAPSHAPFFSPSVSPTLFPTDHPSRAPSKTPSIAPTVSPTDGPTSAPTFRPTYPSAHPSKAPTLIPSMPPTTVWYHVEADTSWFEFMYVPQECKTRTEAIEHCRQINNATLAQPKSLEIANILIHNVFDYVNASTANICNPPTLQFKKLVILVDGLYNRTANKIHWSDDTLCKPDYLSIIDTNHQKCFGYNMEHNTWSTFDCSYIPYAFVCQHMTPKQWYKIYLDVDDLQTAIVLITCGSIFALIFIIALVQFLYDAFHLGRQFRRAHGVITLQNFENPRNIYLFITTVSCLIDFMSDLYYIIVTEFAYKSLWFASITCLCLPLPVYCISLGSMIQTLKQNRQREEHDEDTRNINQTYLDILSNYKATFNKIHHCLYVEVPADEDETHCFNQFYWYLPRACRKFLSCIVIPILQIVFLVLFCFCYTPIVFVYYVVQCLIILFFMVYLKGALSIGILCYFFQTYVNMLFFVQMSRYTTDDTMRSTFNRAFATEVLCESIPQIFIVNLNHYLIGGDYSSSIYWLTVISSVVVVVNAGWNLVCPCIGTKSCRKGLEHKTYYFGPLGATQSLVGTAAQMRPMMMQMTNT